MSAVRHQRVTFGLLGEVEVRCDGQLLDLGAKQRAVLAVLLAEPNTVVLRHAIVDAVWDAEDRDRRNVQKLVTDYLSRIRASLRTAGISEQLVRLTATRTEEPGYRIEIAMDPPEVTIDWQEFRRLCDRAKAAHDANDLDDAERLYEQALAQWRGPALAGLGASPLQAIRAKMTIQRLNAAEQLAAIHLDREQPTRAVAVLEHLAAEHPGRERIAALLIRALDRVGRRDEASVAYLNTRTHLDAEYGVEPGGELEQAHREVLRGRQPEPKTAVLNNLPPDTPHFVGRGSYVDGLRAQLLQRETAPGAVVICAVDGMAGIGKTALAVHVAHKLAPQFSDGCVFLDLRGYTAGATPMTPEQALDVLLRRIGIPGSQIPGDLDERASLWRAELASRRVLLTLDNAASSGQVEPLLPGTGGSRVLITSRNSLTSLDDARHVSLDILGLADARTLFHRIAGAQRVAGMSDSVGNVVRLCGYLPLAIRIIAARCRSYPLTELEKALAAEYERLAEIDDGDRSVAAAFAISFDGLPAQQQRFFRMLGLHPGQEIGSPAAASLAGLDTAAAGRLLQLLRNANLLEYNGDGRYRFHDLMRSYAKGLAAQQPRSDQRAALRREAAWYLHAAALTDRLFAPYRERVPLAAPTPRVALPEMSSTDDALKWCDVERANVLAVVGAAHANGDHDIAWQLPALLGEYFYSRRHLTHWLSTHEIGLAGARELGDKTGESWMLTNLAIAYVELERFQDALQTLETAVGTLRAYLDAHPSDPVASHLLGLALTVSGDALEGQGMPLPAIQFHEEALTINETMGNAWATVWVLSNLARANLRLERPDQAIAYLRRAVEGHKQLNNEWRMGTALTDLGHALECAARHQEALESYGDALRIHRRVGGRWQEARTLLLMGEPLRALRRSGEADEHAELANHILHQLDDRRPV
ncbi:AfsR/SARP family transcriptional regulator [Streptomyces tauricus]|uniref:AfsR/SARP family transcriptional regulator n=1 Tax=Streptomyces tauricus TaxID=68274 RepID=UPI002244787F|nr:BTAD domain-containing putative transcriptional regulator [Streptomyces tauricus]MCW8103450.1 BTAD domain-containing putative transcriptional regulator [Streptomyces tauricus]